MTDLGAGLPRLLTPDEAAQLLRITRKALYAKHARGRLPGARHDGRRLLISREDLVAYIDGKAAHHRRQRRSDDA